MIWWWSLAQGQTVKAGLAGDEFHFIANAFPYELPAG